MQSARLNTNQGLVVVVVIKTGIDKPFVASLCKSLYFYHFYLNRSKLFLLPGGGCALTYQR